MRNRLWVAPLSASLLLSACGSSNAATPAATTATSGGEARARTASSEDLPLDPMADVPGTGVSIRAPRGSEPNPYGAGFVHRARRVQIIVAAARGSAEVMQAFRAGVEVDAESLSTEEVEIAGRPTTLHIDHQESGDVVVERVWAIVETGDRAMVVGGMYDAERSERLQELVRASVLSAAWDPMLPLDPEAALGYRLTAPEGLVLERSTTGSVTYGVEGQMVPPQLGSPTVFLMALPGTIPLSQRDEACEQILVQAGPIPDERVRTRARFDTDSLEGCELTGWQENERADGTTRRLATYAALIFMADEMFMVAGVSAEEDKETWLPRFAEAARTVRATR